jgi:hypothetical protein
MNTLSDHAKQELFGALDGKKPGVFVMNGKLVSIEVENMDVNHEKNLAEEIEEYPELKDSLEKYLINPEMKRFTKSELKVIRHARRK